MSEEIQRARQEVWEFAKTISGNLTADQYKEIFQCGGDYEVFDKYTYEGAKELFETWSQKNIEVGDICVCDKWVTPFVVTGIIDGRGDEKYYDILSANGYTSNIGFHAEGLRKTGRKIDVDSLLASISD